MKRKRSWTARSSRPPRQSPKAGMRCRDCAIPRCKSNDLALAISTLGEELAADSTNHRPAGIPCQQLKASREICTPSFETRSTRLLPRRCGTRFVTPRHGRSRLKSVMTLSNSDCGCGTMERVLIQRFSPSQGSEGHFGLPGHAGTRHAYRRQAESCGAKSMRARKWNCAFLPAPPYATVTRDIRRLFTQGRRREAGAHERRQLANSNSCG